jgi:hypothetical protein
VIRRSFCSSFSPLLLSSSSPSFLRQIAKLSPALFKSTVAAFPDQLRNTLEGALRSAVNASKMQAQTAAAAKTKKKKKRKKLALKF